MNLYGRPRTGSYGKALLSEDLPKARVYTYGYDSRIYSRDYISGKTFYGYL